VVDVDSTQQFLRHVMVVGGTLGDWDDLGVKRWDERVTELGAVAANAGATFLTLRAFEPGTRPSDSTGWERMVNGCHVIIDPCGDGRERFAQAMADLPADEPINEATISEMLYAPADYEPDLIVVLGEPTRLPPSLVWELAYGELVFRPMAWHELSKEHLVEAIADFAQRERRFGGLDESDESVG
jgi:undecaprenyl diphosphate synthase